MSHAMELSPDQKKRRAIAVADIARDTEAPREIVKNLYDEEIAHLAKEARIKQFVSVIAIKRVKERIRSLGSLH